ncbi:hypothetical protein FRC10_003177 [Ceratobasidium sp. 414]|nr:hypothetical protein FRC10_003177 [Ceratobasidium sp. 414]
MSQQDSVKVTPPTIMPLEEPISHLVEPDMQPTQQLDEPARPCVTKSPATDAAKLPKLEDTCQPTVKHRQGATDSSAPLHRPVLALWKSSCYCQMTLNYFEKTPAEYNVLVR